LPHGGDDFSVIPGAGGEKTGRARVSLAHACRVGGESNATLGIDREKSRVVGARVEPIAEDRLDGGTPERRKGDSLAARPNRRQEARGVVADEDEKRTPRRLLEGLEECVLRVLGERLCFLEERDLAATAERSAGEEEL